MIHIYTSRDSILHRILKQAPVKCVTGLDMFVMYILLVDMALFSSKKNYKNILDSSLYWILQHIYEALNIDTNNN
jgi:hypothetical protein